MFEKILVAHDGSDGAQRAFETALELSARLNADLYMVSVEENLPHYAQTVAEVDGEKEKADELFGEISAQCRRRAMRRGKSLLTSIIAGHGAKPIVEFTRQGGFDLLVVGYQGHSMIYDHIWGGKAQNVARLAPCSVLVVK